MAEEELSQDEIDALTNNSGGTDDASGNTEQSQAAGADANGVDLGQNEIDELLKQAGAATASQPEEVVARPVEFSTLPEKGATSDPKSLDFIMDVSLEVSVELGQVRMQVKDVLQLGLGSVIQLNKLAGEPVDILVNGKLIAHGEVVVVDENFGVKIVDVVSAEQRVKNMV